MSSCPTRFDYNQTCHWLCWALRREVTGNQQEGPTRPAIDLIENQVVTRAMCPAPGDREEDPKHVGAYAPFMQLVTRELFKGSRTGLPLSWFEWFRLIPSFVTRRYKLCDTRLVTVSDFVELLGRGSADVPRITDLVKRCAVGDYPEEPPSHHDATKYVKYDYSGYDTLLPLVRRAALYSTPATWVALMDAAEKRAAGVECVPLPKERPMPFVPLTPDERKQWKVIRCTEPGHRPPNMIVVTEPMKWVCPGCGQETMVFPNSARMNTRSPFVAPTAPDGDYQEVEFKPERQATWNAKPRRTCAQVIAERGTVTGCCNRHADNLVCDCLVRAKIAAGCEECGGSGYAVHPQNGWNRNARRCSRDCAVRCAVCNNLNCDNPDGQH